MTRLMGIVNFTPDSFSDGGKYNAVESALNHIDQLIQDGAHIIDIGAESTRPGAAALSAEEEWERLAPLFAALDISQSIFSLDTRHPENAKRALDKGFHWINDVSGFQDDAMIEAVKTSNCKLVVMHSLSVPADKNKVLPEDCDVIETLTQWIEKSSGELLASGIGKDRIIFDPGLGFGKTATQSWEIIERINELKNAGFPLLIGHSRKSFLGAERDMNTLAVSKQLMVAGVEYLRVHDVRAHRGLHG